MLKKAKSNEYTGKLYICMYVCVYVYTHTHITLQLMFIDSPNPPSSVVNNPAPAIEM